MAFPHSRAGCLGSHGRFLDTLTEGTATNHLVPRTETSSKVRAADHSVVTVCGTRALRLLGWSQAPTAASGMAEGMGSSPAATRLQSLV